MLSALRKRMSYANVVATLALLFAMSGGALAASHYLITSTKQIKPSVLASLKGKAGAAGKAGPAGPVGPAGPAGAGSQGPAGATGGTGKEGPVGKEGPLGKEGPAGKEGSPWTAGGTLPKKKTETGVWAAVAGPFVENLEGSFVVVPISFTIPLAHAPNVTIVTGGAFGSSECPSTQSELEAGAIAKAAAGFLCVYGVEMPSGGLTPAPEVSANGVVLSAKNTASLAGEPSSGWWAVTAE